MKKVICLLFFLCFVLISCYDVEITPYPSKLKFAPKNANDIIIFKYVSRLNRCVGIIEKQNGEKEAFYLNRDYEIIAEIQVTGFSSVKKIENKMKEEAAKIGGDAILIYVPGSTSYFEVDKTTTKIYRDARGNYTVDEGNPVYAGVSSEIGYIIKWKN